MPKLKAGTRFTLRSAPGVSAVVLAGAVRTITNAGVNEDESIEVYPARYVAWADPALQALYVGTFEAAATDMEVVTA